MIKEPEWEERENETKEISENCNSVSVYYAVDYWICSVYSRTVDLISDHEFF